MLHPTCGGDVARRASTHGVFSSGRTSKFRANQDCVSCGLHVSWAGLEYAYVSSEWRAPKDLLGTTRIEVAVGDRVLLPRECYWAAVPIRVLLALRHLGKARGA